MTIIAFYQKQKRASDFEFEFNANFIELANGIFLYHDEYNPNSAEEIVLPLPLIPGDTDKTIIFIPVTVKKFIPSILERLGFQTRDSQIAIPRELGLGKEEPRTKFYDYLTSEKNDLEIQEVITMPTPKEKAITELLEVFNNMAAEENEIDAAMIVRCDDDEAEIMFSSEPKTGARRVDIDSFSAQMRYLYSLLKMTTKVNDKMGSLEHVPFQFTGGIIHVTHLPHLDEAFKRDENIFLVFVSATREGMEMLKLARQRRLKEITPLLKTIMG